MNKPHVLSADAAKKLAQDHARLASLLPVSPTATRTTPTATRHVRWGRTVADENGDYPPPPANTFLVEFGERSFSPNAAGETTETFTGYSPPFIEAARVSRGQYHDQGEAVLCVLHLGQWWIISLASDGNTWGVIVASPPYPWGPFGYESENCNVYQVSRQVGAWSAAGHGQDTKWLLVASDEEATDEAIDVTPTAWRKPGTVVRLVKIDDQWLIVGPPELQAAEHAVAAPGYTGGNKTKRMLLVEDAWDGNEADEENPAGIIANGIHEESGAKYSFMASRSGTYEISASYQVEADTNAASQLVNRVEIEVPGGDSIWFLPPQRCSLKVWDDSLGQQIAKSWIECSPHIVNEDNGSIITTCLTTIHIHAIAFLAAKTRVIIFAEAGFELLEESGNPRGRVRVKLLHLDANLSAAPSAP